ncbi:hypothetical protein C6Y14_13300 [Streptomyces dioscori]|uniref:Uncharacterized protein n=1 Tax=Streptomyces dioscori TaxID=2109333 RepID=A0A2P8QA45_9ACTN|nr:hypothetical protein C6Y14_13300 [Streptomyces dioscori]
MVRRVAVFAAAVLLPGAFFAVLAAVFFAGASLPGLRFSAAFFAGAFALFFAGARLRGRGFSSSSAASPSASRLSRAESSESSSCSYSSSSYSTSSYSSSGSSSRLRRFLPPTPGTSGTASGTTPASWSCTWLVRPCSRSARPVIWRSTSAPVAALPTPRRSPRSWSPISLNCGLFCSCVETRSASARGLRCIRLPATMVPTAKASFIFFVRPRTYPAPTARPSPSRFIV